MKTIAFLILTIFYFLLSNFYCSAQGSGYALDFDGVNDYCKVSTSSVLEPSSFTLEAWVKVSASGENSIIQNGSTSDWTGSERSGYWMLINSSNRLQSYIIVNDDWYLLSGTTSLNSNQWYHTTCTYDGSNWKLYLNGVLDASSIRSGPIDYTGNYETLRIGTRAHSVENWSFFNGDIDEVRIWNRALTQTEIQENMCQKLTGTEPGLVAYYRMDEGVDNTCSGGEDVCDLTGNGNHGTKY